MRIIAVNIKKTIITLPIGNGVQGDWTLSIDNARLCDHLIDVADNSVKGFYDILEVQPSGSRVRFRLRKSTETTIIGIKKAIKNVNLSGFTTKYIPRLR
jgi:hypothetical protein